MALSAEAAAARARAWHHAVHETVCDVLEPWAHGTVARATRYPCYFDFNVVRVEEQPAMDVRGLAGFADTALAGVAHRRLDFELPLLAEQLREDFIAMGWRATGLLWMRQERATPDGPTVPVEEVPYGAVDALRVAWHREDFPDPDPAGFHAQAREVAQLRGARVLAIHEHGAPVAFAQLERDRAAAEITQVYVDPAHRGRGLGAAIVRAAIAHASEVEDLWICADAEDWPQRLYMRLGFKAVWKTIEFLRLP
jgi:GNAT superfamily N-acetyltransferase